MTCFRVQEPVLHLRQAHHGVDRRTPAREQHRGVIRRQLLRRPMRQRDLATTASGPLAPAIAFTLAPVPSLAVALTAAVAFTLTQAFVSAPTSPTQRIDAPATILVFSPCQHHAAASIAVPSSATTCTAAAIP